jgi:hypothetical protein
MRITASGILGDAIKSMAEGFKQLFGSALGDGVNMLERIAAMIAAIIANLPALLAAAWEGIKSIGEYIIGFLKGILSILSTIDKIAFGGFFTTLTNDLVAFVTGAADAFQKGGISGVIGDISKTFQDFLSRIKGANASGIGAAIDPSADRALQGLAGRGGRGDNTLRDVLSALSPKDFRRFALGGGDVGRQGLTDVELARIGAFGSKPQVSVRVQVVGVGTLEDFFKRMFEEAFRQFEEQRSRVVAARP